MSEGANSIDSDLAKSLLEEDDEIENELLALQMGYMRDCQPFRERQKEAFKSAVEQGMPKEAWRLALKEHRIKRKAARQIENLYAETEDDTRETVEMIRDAVGEDYASLPLGDAAIRRAKGEDGDAPPAEPEAPKKPRGRPRKDASASSANTIDDLGDDPRPAFLRDKEAQRVKEAEERLAGMQALDDGDVAKTLN